MDVVKLAAGIFDAAGKQLHFLPVELDKVKALQVSAVVNRLVFTTRLFLCQDIYHLDQLTV